jgi:hypothetical protein
MTAERQAKGTPCAGSNLSAFEVNLIQNEKVLLQRFNGGVAGANTREP